MPQLSSFADHESKRGTRDYDSAYCSHFAWRFVVDQEYRLPRFRAMRLVVPTTGGTVQRYLRSALLTAPSQHRLGNRWIRNNPQWYKSSCWIQSPKVPATRVKTGSRYVGFSSSPCCRLDESKCTGVNFDLRPSTEAFPTVARHSQRLLSWVQQLQLKLLRTRGRQGSGSQENHLSKLQCGTSGWIVWRFASQVATEPELLAAPGDDGQASKPSNWFLLLLLAEAKWDREHGDLIGPGPRAEDTPQDERNRLSLLVRVSELVSATSKPWQNCTAGLAISCMDAQEFSSNLPTFQKGSSADRREQAPEIALHALFTPEPSTKQ
ncbi:hypothetical protein QBC37DRAFT_398518 [Rhypophila decipiens]|uniref:Uncharacterized protein n=1 Tax=Rhypophila decipiens TaxID=261697 RepID=A0AAN6YAS2_9PEZI|nr:hypothetical protein QBC37DRAFT_398518 [Rhypophila decipiens]